MVSVLPKKSEQNSLSHVLIWEVYTNMRPEILRFQGIFGLKCYLLFYFILGSWCLARQHLICRDDDIWKNCYNFMKGKLILFRKRLFYLISVNNNF